MELGEVSSYLPFGKSFREDCFRCVYKMQHKWNMHGHWKKACRHALSQTLSVHNLGVGVSQEPFPIGKTCM